jgi:hypothetical protein
MNPENPYVHRQRTRAELLNVNEEEEAARENNDQIIAPDAPGLKMDVTMET